MKPTQRNLDDLAHAHWRVRFLKNLLEVHRGIPQRANYDWLLQEADYLQRIRLAEREVMLKSGMHAEHRGVKLAMG